MSKYQNISLHLIFLSFLSIYLINQPIEFQCDSAQFYNSGSYIANLFYNNFNLLLIPIFFLVGLFLFIIFKIIISRKKIYIIIAFLIFIFLLFFLSSLFPSKTQYTAIIDFARPPIYSIFLFFSGIFLFDSFLPIILTQSILSYFSVLLIYKSLFYLTNQNINFTYYSTIIFSLTSLPYILVKFIIAEQLLYFLAILNLYFMISFYYKKKYIFLYFAVVSSIFCWLTKWEGQIIFLATYLFIFLVFFKISNRKKYFINLLGMLTLSFLILFSWTLTRSLQTNDFSSFFNISNSTMDQSFYKVYTVLPSEVATIENTFDYKSNVSIDFKSDILPDQPIGKIIISEKNGANSSILYKHIHKIVSSNKESYEWYEKPLDQAYRSNSQKNIDFYYELFEKFDNNSNLITDNIFNQPNIYYFNYINYELNLLLGKDKKNDLYTKVIIEAIKTHPLILLNIFSDYITSFGIQLKFKKISENKNFTLDFVKETSGDFINPLNAGNCAYNNMSKNHFIFYENSHNNRDKFSLISKIINFNDNLNDALRNYIGPFLIIIYLILIFNNFILYFPIISIPILLNLSVTVFVDAPVNSKYEVITFSLNYVFICSGIYLLFKFLKVFLRNQKKSNN